MKARIGPHQHFIEINDMDGKQKGTQKIKLNLTTSVLFSANSTPDYLYFTNEIATSIRDVMNFYYM